ncbi:MAG: hypothetical protein KKH77_01325 [Candidatus Omnitrophica bacterium]|nr:hypothetical protein [Candidatus Omnitrophota bacterium]MBU0881182.1 hypothetical protein [Candidatus Omnitrophota bacterium]MBU0895757.1 hypothetical protein [Candidatus Omnitrophota bacterium]MBU1038007.1 hypothetical protein [Candidatus Omnitrophota bacterium]MBU1809263.1 hypothetical protein [Candidatus Omnitrophota bacterium]
MWLKVIKFIAGILAIPLMAAVTRAFYGNIVGVVELAGILKYFMWGVGAYIVLHLLFFKPMFIYVLGHEAVHAVTSWVMGGKINSFKVSDKGGSVSTTKTNAVVELSPYFIPIYAIILMAVYFVVAYSYKINGAVFIFLIGFTLTLHLVMTIEVMKIRQPDLMKSGYLFSIVIVYVLNIIIIAMLFSLLFPSFSSKKFFADSYVFSRDIYAVIIRQMFF